MDKPLILIVEDDVDVANSTAKLIRASGEYNVIVANSANDALKEIKKERIWLGLGGNRIKLILLDIKMPGMDGLQFLKEIRKTNNDENIGVIMVTAYEDEEKWEEATSGFVAGYIRKPFEEKQLLDAINKFFSNPDARYKMTLETFEKHIHKMEEFKQQKESAG